ncbi:MAG: hypothetical protein B7X28_05875 [Halothiobacillus sp. 13-55-253]|nr:MAG: hypothetical protein B7X28_05875 [Halothiobacillus sp. 13-55-253]
MLLLNPEGKVIHSFVGERSYTDMASIIQSAVDSALAANTLTHPKLPLKPLSADNHFMVLPTKIAVNDHRVAISDTGHDQIRIFDHKGNLLATIGDGKAGFADGSFATAEFNRPQGIAWLGDDLYVADTDNQRIRRVDFASQTVSTVVGNGQRVFLNEVTESAKDTPLNSPWGLEAVNGDLFIAMAGDHAVWRYDPKTRKLDERLGLSRSQLVCGRS